MATKALTCPLQKVQRPLRVGSLWNDRIIIFSLYWLLVGAGIDIWAHFNGATDNTFFTPWHAVLYSGLLASIVATLRIPYFNAINGYRFQQIIPPGYRLAFMGTAVSSVAGMSDMLWHLAFGVEGSIEAQFSPTHLALATGFIMIMSGPFIAMVMRSRDSQQLTWRESLAGILSLGGSFALVRAIFLYLSPYEAVLPATKVFTGLFANAMVRGSWTEWIGIALGSSDLFWETAFFVTLFLLVARSIRLPFGGWTVIYLLGPLLLSGSLFHFQAFPAAFLVGLAMDVICLKLDLSQASAQSLMKVSTGLGLFFGLCYFGSLALNGGTWYVIHIWLGDAMICGAVGFAISFLIVYPHFDRKTVP
jgi:hypothetical protein